MPTPVADTAAATVFSEQRARALARQLCRAAHPTGSEAQRAVADWIVAYAQRVAAEAPGQFVVDVAVRSNNSGWAAWGSTLMWWPEMNNVVVTLTPRSGGRGSEAALLLSSHYDTVTMSPGCYDDSSGVAVQLEILRNVAYGPATRHALVFAFVSGEEIGLLGAYAFADGDPLRRNVSAFVDMDSTPGNKAGLFLSSGSLLDELYARDVAQPFGSVFQHDMLNSPLISSLTDWMTYAQHGGLPGIGMGYSNRRIFYHTTQDVYARLQLGSLQQFGDAVLPVARAAADHPQLRRAAGPPSVYFDLFQSHMVRYSRATSAALHCLLVAALAALLAYTVLRSAWTDAAHQCLWLAALLLQLVLDFLLAVAACCLFYLLVDAALPPLWFQNAPVLVGLTTSLLSALLLLAMHECCLPAAASRLRAVWPLLAERYRPVAARRPFATIGDAHNNNNNNIDDDDDAQQAHLVVSGRTDSTALIQSGAAVFAFQLYGVAAWYLLLAVVFLPVAFTYGSTYLVFWPALFVFLALLLHELVVRAAHAGHRWAAWTERQPAAFFALLSLLAVVFPACVLASTVVPVFGVLLVDTRSAILPALFLLLLSTFVVYPLLPLLTWSCAKRAARTSLYAFLVVGLLVLLAAAVAFPRTFTPASPLGVYVSQRVARQPVVLQAGAPPVQPNVTASALRVRAVVTADQLRRQLRAAVDLRPWQCRTDGWSECSAPVAAPDTIARSAVAVVHADAAQRNLSFAADFPCNTAQLTFEPKPLAWSFSDQAVRPSVLLVGGFGGLGSQQFWVAFPPRTDQVRITVAASQDDLVDCPAVADFLDQMPGIIIATGRGTGLLITDDQLSFSFD